MKSLLPASIALIAASCIPQQQATQSTATKPADPYATAQTYPQATYPPATTTTQTPVYPPATTPTYPPATSAPTYPTAPSTAPAVGGQSYTIQKGDTLYGISRQFGTSIDALRSANSISGDLIHPGQSIVIP